MPLGLMLRLLIVLTAVEVTADVIGLAALWPSLDRTMSWWILIVVLSLTAASDMGFLGYLLWVNPPAVGVAPAPGAISRGAIKAGLYCTTLALLATGLAAFLLITGIVGYPFTPIAIGIFLVIILVADIVASVAVLKR